MNTIVTGGRPTREQCQLNSVISGAVGVCPKPVGVEISDKDISSSTVVIRTYGHSKYRGPLGMNQYGVLGFVEKSGVLNIGDKFDAAISTLRAPFPNFDLGVNGHPQLYGGLGVGVRSRAWLFFSAQRDEWAVVGEAVNFVVLANMVFLAKKAYHVAVQRKWLACHAVVPAGFTESMAVITACFDCTRLSEWVEKQDRDVVLRLAQLFY